MLHKHSIFAYSPELGSFNPKSNSFYPEAEYHHEIITEDYKVVDAFIHMHLPLLKLVKEYSGLVPQKYIVGFRRSSHRRRKIIPRISKPSIKVRGSKTYKILIFLKSAASLKGVKLIFLFDKDLSTTYSEVNGFMKFGFSRKVGAIETDPVKIKDVTGGFMTQEMDWERRTYGLFEFSRGFGESNEFVVLVEKDNMVLRRFVHVIDINNFGKFVNNI